MPAIPADGQANGEQQQADNHRGHRFVFAVAKAVVLVGGATCQTDKEHDHNIGGKVAQGVDSIGQHSCTIANDSCKEFEEREQEIA